MPIATYKVNGEIVSVRAFSVPKIPSELKYWYRGAAKKIPELPKWEELRGYIAHLDVETICVGWDDNMGLRNRLFIARKRHI